MSRLLLGTCSWKYPSWEGLVYSQARGINYLAEYARKYDTVEIDQWFWSLFDQDTPILPKPETVGEYAESVPDDFVFTIKVPNSITLTHHYNKHKSTKRGSVKDGKAGRTQPEPRPNRHFLSPALFEEFLGAIGPLLPRVGSLMFQFEYLNRTKMAGQGAFQEAFAAFISKIPPEYPYSIECRNPNYLNKAFFEFLRARRIDPVFMQGYYMPDIAEVFETARDSLRDGAVIRLHGNDRPGIEKRTGKKYHRIVDVRDEEIDTTAGMIREMLDRQMTVILNVNNHFEGSAPLTIEKIRDRLGEG